MARACYKSRRYCDLIGHKYASPECKYGYEVEAHHITPLKNRGYDTYWNLIALCGHCHRKCKIHRNFEQQKIILFTWKCIQELELFGFILDEEDEDFDLKLKQAGKR